MKHAYLNNLRSLWLVVVMLLSATTMWAKVNETFSDNVIMYKITSENPIKEVTVDVYNGDASISEFKIPATVTYNDVEYSVTSISANAFQDASALTSVTIPSSVKTIGKLAFRGCSNLIGINIPKGVTTIGQGAFNGCSSLEWVSIGKDVTSIARDAFKGCVKVENVFCYADPALLSWNDYGCDDFKTDGSTKCLVKEADLASVKAKWSTGNASADVNVTFADGLGLFSDGTYKYRIIDISDESEYTVAIYGYVGEKLEGEIEIPRSVSYDYKAHMRYSSFDVISIDNAAFAGCLGMTSIIIPHGVKSIGDYAFDGCADLTSVSIGEDVVSIGKDAFYCCENVTEVICNADPDKLTWNEDGCNDFKADGSTVCRVKDTKKWKEKFGGIVNATFKMGFDAFFEKDGLMFVINSSQLNTVDLATYADPNNPPSEIVVPATVEYDGEEYVVTDIMAGAFSECETLTTISFAENSKITAISESAFQGCENLLSVTLPAGLKTILDGAFYNCTKLESITLPDGFEGFGEGAFAGCTSLKSINIPTSVEFIPEFAFMGCSSLRSISLPANLFVIDDGAFYECTALSSIVFPDKLTYIMSGAFYNCTGLTELIIPASVQSIKADAFFGCTNVTDVYCYADPAKLEWKDNECNDFKADKATVCHVAADKLAEFEAKWSTGNASTDLNATFGLYDAPNGLAFSETEATVKMGEDYTLPTLKNLNSLSVTWKSSDEKVAKVNASTGAVTLVAPGKTTITATFDGNKDFLAGSVNYALTVKAGKGDVNHDGKVNKTDIQLVVNYIMTGKADGIYLDEAKMNADTKVDAADLVLLINKVK